jgi:hypothetical protein
MDMMQKHATKGVVALVCLVAAPLALAACSSGGNKSPSATATTVKSGAKTPDPVDPRLSVTNNVSARQDVTLTSCQNTKGAWVAKGVVTNSTAATATYTLQITYTDAQATVLGVVKTEVSPASKKSLPWTTSWTSSEKSGVQCILDAVSRS